MTTQSELVEQVEALFSTREGEAKARRVLGYLRSILSREAELEVLRASVRKRSGVAFFATIGQVLAERPLFDVRVHGRQVGTVEVRSREERRFTPASAYRARFVSAIGKARADWAEVRPFLDAVRPALGGKASEAMVQQMAFSELAISDAEKQPLLRGSQPVQVLGMPFQFPMPISASGKTPELAGGEKSAAIAHSDILARVGTGRGTAVRVLELKKPGASARSALQQAIVYAATLEHLFKQERETVLQSLGFKTTWPKMAFEAAAFVEESQRAIVQKSAEPFRRGAQRFPLYGYYYRLEGERLVVTGVDRLDADDSASAA